MKKEGKSLPFCNAYYTAGIYGEVYIGFVFLSIC